MYRIVYTEDYDNNQHVKFRVSRVDAIEYAKDHAPAIVTWNHKGVYAWFVKYDGSIVNIEV